MSRKTTPKARVPALLKRKSSSIVKRAAEKVAKKSKTASKAVNATKRQAKKSTKTKVVSSKLDPVELELVRDLELPENRSSLANVPKEYAFWVCNGTYVHNLHELADAIESMGEEQFKTHVNNNKNDFSSWVRDVIGEVDLAEKLMSSDDKNEHHVHVLKHLVRELSKK